MRTRSGLPKGCVWNLDRENGKRRVRFRNRKTGFSTYIYGTPWSEDFMRQYAAAVEGSKDRKEIVTEKRTVSGSVSALVLSYLASPNFKDLKDSTQAFRKGVLERFRADYGDLPVKGLTRAVIMDIMAAKSNTKAAANNWLKVLRYVLDHAIALGMLSANPAASIKKYRIKSDGHHTWTEDEIATFQNRHPIDTRPGLALALLLFTGQRRGDVCRMGRQHRSGDLIAVRQEKTDTPLMIPLHPVLKRALDALPLSNLSYLTTERGAAFTSAGFGNWFRDRCNEAGLPQCSAHGLRKAAATQLANLGCTNEQIKAITGHRSDASLAPYTRAADQVRLARQAMARWAEEGGPEREQEVVQHRNPLDQKTG
jgi:integrase